MGAACTVQMQRAAPKATQTRAPHEESKLIQTVDQQRGRPIDQANRRAELLRRIVGARHVPPRRLVWRPTSNLATAFAFLMHHYSRRRASRRRIPTAISKSSCFASNLCRNGQNPATIGLSPERRPAMLTAVGSPNRDRVAASPKGFFDRPSPSRHGPHLPPVSRWAPAHPDRLSWRQHLFACGD